MHNFKPGDVVWDGFHYGVVLRDPFMSGSDGPYCWWDGWDGRPPIAWVERERCTLVTGPKADAAKLAYMKALIAGRVSPDL